MQSIPSAFFARGGNAGDLFRAQEWEKTALGPPELWPQALMTLVRVMLNSGQPMFVAWGSQRFLLYNDAYSKMMGRRHPGAFAKPFFETWPEVTGTIGDLMDRVFAGEPIHMEDLQLTLYRNGYPEEAHFSFSYTPVPDDNNQIVGLFCACTETTGRVSEDRQQAVDAKRERDRLFEITRDLIGVASLDGYLLSINPAWSRQLDRSMEELLAKPFSEIIHPDDLAETGAVVARLQAGEPVHQFHVRLLKADGTPLSFAWSASPDHDPAAGIFYTVGRDITEDIQREEAIRQGHKMEALGQLTGGLAHDFNNLLQAVQGCLDLILRRPEDLERVTHLAGNALKATARGTKLTAQLLAFSRAQKLELRHLDVDTLIQGMTELLNTSVGPLIAICLDTGHQDLVVSSDPTQLEMALLNLTLNARDAMPEGGKLVISASHRDITNDPDLAPGSYVEIRVTDNGTGMPAAVMARAFEPFYTTKGTGRGTGLGLSQVYAVAKQAGGTARIEQLSPHGTSVVMCLPCVERPMSSGGHANEPVQRERYDARKVLLVDDDADVRMFLSAALATLGFVVAEAENAERGLQILDEFAPDLLLVDFAMPGMNGAQMAKVVTGKRPDLPIVFASGYSETAAIEQALGKSATLLRKPFSVSDLEVALSGVFSKSRFPLGIDTRLNSGQ